MQRFTFTFNHFLVFLIPFKKIELLQLLNTLSALAVTFFTVFYDSLLSCQLDFSVTLSPGSNLFFQRNPCSITPPSSKKKNPFAFSILPFPASASFASYTIKTYLNFLSDCFNQKVSLARNIENFQIKRNFKNQIFPFPQVFGFISLIGHCYCFSDSDNYSESNDFISPKYLTKGI